MNNEGNIATPDGVRLFFRTSGNGAKTVVIPNGIYLLEDFRSLAEDRTLIAYDPRNRGRSDQTGDGSIQQDLEDMEPVRQHFGLDRMDLIGHSYVGLMVALYAMRYPDHTGRIVQIGAMEPVAGKQYPPHLAFNDGLMPQIFGKMGQLWQSRTTEDDEEMCRKAWAILGAIYVADPINAARIDWGRCELPNERNFMRYWTAKILPSIQSLNIPGEATKAKSPILTIHGTMDRNAPYGGGREWAMMLPDARLVTVEGAAHAPWMEAPDRVFGAIGTFLNGAWPEGSEKVEAVDLKAASA
ncbi:MAG TPA: alpha/beta hydrolase [Bryobacteraceae bacterium]|nr:alpha/beta hydrolase [Bryobacteraceae bacterium]